MTTRAVLPGVTLHPLGTLGGSKRSAVRRARAERPDGRTNTVIVKTFAEPEGWAREASALAVLPPDTHAPRLLAAGADPPVVVMSDLGDGTSVADALLSADGPAAASALDAWAEAIAAIHVATIGLRDAFRCELDARSVPKLKPLPVAAAGFAIDEAVGRLRETCEPIAVAVPESLADAFDRDLTVATAVWSVLYSSWFLAADPPNARGLNAPSRRALLLHRLDAAQQTSIAPEIAAFARELRAALVHRWGELTLPLAPAFRPAPTPE